MDYAQAFRGIATCDLSDACDALGIAAVTTGTIKPVYHDCPKICGPAVTYRLTPQANGSVVLGTLEAIAEAPPGSVLLFDAHGYEDRTAWGSIAATVAVQHRMAGAVVDGSTRDVQTMRTLPCPTYAKSTVVTSVRGRLGLESINAPIAVAGQRVDPGWIVAADENGIICFPPDDALEVFRKAYMVAALEEKVMRAIREGADAVAIHKEMRYHASWTEQLGEKGKTK
ncbi:MAG: RraA family protein [Alphaproteobacteria bacterium]